MRDQTVRNRVQPTGLRSRRPVQTPRHDTRELGLALKRANRHWQLRYQHKVLFGEVSKLNLSVNDGQARDWS